MTVSTLRFERINFTDSAGPIIVIRIDLPEGKFAASVSAHDLGAVLTGGSVANTNAWIWKPVDGEWVEDGEASLRLHTDAGPRLQFTSRIGVVEAAVTYSDLISALTRLNISVRCTDAAWRKAADG